VDHSLGDALLIFDFRLDGLGHIPGPGGRLIGESGPAGPTAVRIEEIGGRGRGGGHDSNQRQLAHLFLLGIRVGEYPSPQIKKPGLVEAQLSERE
jgi:hypothetical protein